MILSARMFFALTFLVLAGAFVLSIPYGNSRHPVGMQLDSTCMGGFVAWGVVGLLSRRAKRPFGVVDGARCIGWILIGCSIGMVQGLGYYRYYWPQYANLVNVLSLVAAISGIAVIVLATLLLPAPVPPAPGHCQHCDYNLTGNVSGICPECGTPCKPTTENTTSTS